MNKLLMMDVSEDFKILIVFGMFSLLFILVVFYLLSKNQNSFKSYLKEKNTEDYRNLQTLVFDLHSKFNKEQYDFQSDFKQNFFDSFYKLNENLNEKLSEGVEKGQKSYSSIVERLSKIDEAQKNIENLSKDVGKLQNILTDKKTRGIFGEIQLSQILYNVFGDSKLNYSLQEKLSNGSIVDCLIKLPKPMGKLCIDSKFPLENFQKIGAARKKSKEVIDLERAFKKDLKKHIDDISNKYIISGETSEQAMLFLPAEAIFAEIHAYYPDIIQYAYDKSVWIASPTTLMAILSTVQVVLRNQRQQESAHLIQQELKMLSKEFDLYEQRWDKFNRSIESLGKNASDISITSNKIKKKFLNISDVNLPEKFKES